MAVFFWLGLASLPEAWSRPEYSHGYLIPPIALYLLLTALGATSLERQPNRDQPRRGLGVATVVLGLAIGALGNLVHIADISTYGLIVCIFGLVLTVAGTRQGLKLWVPVFYLFFMLPLPNFIYWPLSIKLQALSSQLGVGVISAFGVPVYLDGNVIDLGSYKLQVAEACSGLRYLFPLTSFGFLFAALYKGPVWHRLVLFLSALPITVLMNSARIGVIGLLVDRWGIKQAEGFLHFFEGWIIFIACVALLFGEAVLLNRLTRGGPSVRSMLEVDVGGLWTQLRRAREIRTTGALMLASAAILAAAVAWLLTSAQPVTAPERSPLILFPAQIGDWHGSRQLLDSDIERVLAANDYVVMDYTSSSGEAPVDFFVAYYDSQTNGSGIHSPQVCIPAGGWEVSKWTTLKTEVPSTSGGLLTVNRAIIEKGLSRQLVYYWFQAARPRSDQRLCGQGLHRLRFPDAWKDRRRTGPRRYADPRGQWRDRRRGEAVAGLPRAHPSAATEIRPELTRQENVRLCPQVRND